ncbi:MAG: bifunctional diaminohydroxyphosphoribosylaminopyrimidine deaminase/5-amino-6-(5-phosphoribosylamino)uracil reductase RibD [Candidatus Krumholzibacteriota bacterium]|nr:bifunctional diaminohydroxyphosphoribosylaminopyrimidine deaminase/5-amino-6-(5-phosphoribosylamino)uracil reductase RibD [Candidatus Krumholzibacteriota bacterium]
MDRDSHHMQRALELAARAAGRAFPNPLVGAVVVRDGEIVGEGHHEAAGRPHAERVALGEAGEKARGAEMYLNLEPCCHHGRTPPCTSAILDAGVRRVVFSIFDPDDRVCGGGASILRAAGIEVCVGVMAREALELNLPYVHRKIAGRAFVLLKLAATLDGRLTAEGRTRLTGDDARRRVHRLRAWAEAIAVGIGTIRADDPLLDRRFAPETPPPPVRMVFDSTLSFPPGHRWLAAGEQTIVYCLEDADPIRRRALEAAGAEIAPLPGLGGRIDLAAWRGDVTARGIVSVLVEGGSEVAGSIIADGLFDRLALFYAPVFGGAEGAPLFCGERPGWLEGNELLPTAVERIGDDLMAVYDRAAVRGYLDRVTTEDERVHGTR